MLDNVHFQSLYETKTSEKTISTVTKDILGRLKTIIED